MSCQDSTALQGGESCCWVLWTQLGVERCEAVQALQLPPAKAGQAAAMGLGHEFCLCDRAALWDMRAARCLRPKLTPNRAN